MRKVILSIATSLDGHITGPSGEIDWLFFQDHDYGYAGFYAGRAAAFSLAHAGPRAVFSTAMCLSLSVVTRKGRTLTSSRHPHEVCSLPTR